MRDFLTYLGIALILVLTALLGAPYVIDFDAHRARFAEEISRATGAQARIDGPIEFRVLPTPYFSAKDLSLKGPLGSIKAEKADFELSLPALMQGAMTFARAELSHFALELDADQLRKPTTSVRFDNLVLRDGALRVLHAGKAFIALEKVDLTGRLASDGPYDLRGAFRAGDRVVHYALGSERFSGTRLPLKLALDTDQLGRLSLDGELDIAAGPAFAGKISAEGAAAPGAWRAEGDFAARPESLKLEKATLHLGEGAQAAHLSGGGEFGVDAGAIAVDFSGPRLDGAWAETAAGALARAMERPAPTRLRAQLDALTWRGAWSHIKLSRDPGGPLKIVGEGAGGARFDVAVAREGKGWRGKGDFSTIDYAAFAADADAPALPFRQVAVGGLFTYSSGALALSNAVVALDRAKFSGDVAWAPATREARAKLAAKLTASALDLSATPDYGAALGDADLDLTLDAQTVGKAEGKLSLRLLREKGFSRLERLEGKNLAGADVSASGEWKDRFSALKGSVRLKAGELQDFATLLARLVPNDATRLLASRAKIVSPATLNAKAEAGGFAFDGQAAATKFSASLDDKGGITLDVSAPEAFDLLAQLGAPPLLSPQKLGPGQISVQTRSQDGRRVVTGRAGLGKINGQFDGALRDGAVEGALALAGDPSSLIGGPAGNGRIDGQVEARDGRIVLRKMVGERGDAHFSGELVLSSDGVSGQLDVDQFSAPAFLALTLGPAAPAKPGALWPSLSFAPVVIDPPRTKLAIRAAELAPFGVPAKFDLSLAANALRVANIEAQAAGGVLRGGFELRRAAGQATLSGEVSGEGLTLKNPALSVVAGGKIKFGGSGASMAALVGALSGTGAAKLSDVTVAGAAPDAAEQVLAAQAASEKPFNAKESLRDLDQALAQGPLKIADGESPLRLAKGEVKLGRDGVAFTYDLNDLSFSLDAALPEKQGELNWSGAWSSPTRKIDAAPFVAVAAAKALEREQARIARQREADRQRKLEVERRKQEELARKQAEKLQQQAPQPAPAAAPPQ